MVPRPEKDSSLRVGVVSDTHGVADQAVLDAFRAAEVDLILHAGDVGSHGGHAEILKFFGSLTKTIAVRGNVDDTASLEELPEHTVEACGDYSVFITHIADPRICHTEAWKGIDSVPDIVVHGHTHKYSVKEEGGILFINPGSAGPARFKLPRTAAVLELQPKALGLQAKVMRIDLAPKGPPRLPAATAQVKRKRKP
ncbi:hypothetical protein CVIRNUC_010740 [Coccomyxa viridis]|uniref:Vacuolar protein sorting-associated protein 29 n=1 Tax=Coccomyxa viridis TaxID=1274662 RepID=A0AAV1IN33_9CHLO|nr:hypothetical protein CVIRNUC_010740 [Coccomyxa viridis]